VIETCSSSNKISHNLSLNEIKKTLTELISDPSIIVKPADCSTRFGKISTRNSCTIAEY